MFDEQACLQEIKALKAKEIDKIDEIVGKYCQINEPNPEPLQESDFFRKDLIEDKYIPSPDLLSSYQGNIAQTFDLSTRGQNSKLKQLYADKAQKKNQFYVAKHPLSQNPLLKPSIIVEDKEETFLQNLRERKIQATLPQMEWSLHQNQMSNLEKKEINMKNSVPDAKEGREGLAEWRKVRQNLTRNLNRQAN